MLQPSVRSGLPECFLFLPSLAISLSSLLFPSLLLSALRPQSGNHLSRSRSQVGSIMSEAPSSPRQTLYTPLTDNVSPRTGVRRQGMCERKSPRESGEEKHKWLCSNLINAIKLKEMQAEAGDRVFITCGLCSQINPKVEKSIYSTKGLEGGQRIRQNSYHSVAENPKSQLQAIVHSL